MHAALALPSPVALAYIAAALLFIAAAAGLSRHETAVAGNIAGGIGMGITWLAAIGLALLLAGGSAKKKRDKKK